MYHGTAVHAVDFNSTQVRWPRQLLFGYTACSRTQTGHTGVLSPATRRGTAVTASQKTNDTTRARKRTTTGWTTRVRRPVARAAQLAQHQVLVRLQPRRKSSLVRGQLRKGGRSDVEWGWSGVAV